MIIKIVIIPTKISDQIIIIITIQILEITTTIDQIIINRTEITED